MRLYGYNWDKSFCANINNIYRAFHLRKLRLCQYFITRTLNCQLYDRFRESRKTVSILYLNFSCRSKNKEDKSGGNSRWNALYLNDITSQVSKHKQSPVAIEI